MNRSYLTIFFGLLFLWQNSFAAEKVNSVVFRTSHREDINGLGYDSWISLNDFLFRRKNNLLVNVNDLTKAIGRPCELSENTWKKIGKLPSAVRYNFFEFIIHPNWNQRHYYNIVADQGSYEVVPTLNKMDGQRRAIRFLQGIQRNFSDENLADVAVATVLCKIYPKIRTQWPSWKYILNKYDWIIGLGAASLLSSFDALTLKLTRDFFKTKSGDKGEVFRLGWFVNTSRFGFKFQPRVFAGVKGRWSQSKDVLNSFDFSLGWYEDFSLDGTERRSLRLMQRLRVFNKLDDPLGSKWSADIDMENKFIFLHKSEKRVETFQTSLALRAYAENFLGNSFTDLVMSAGISSNYENYVNGSLAIALSDRQLGVNFGLKAFISKADEGVFIADSESPVQELTGQWGVAAYAQGSLSSEQSREFEYLESKGISLRQRVAVIENHHMAVQKELAKKEKVAKSILFERDQKYESPEDGASNEGKRLIQQQRLLMQQWWRDLVEYAHGLRKYALRYPGAGRPGPLLTVAVVVPSPASSFVF